jgi:hypothetical protein
MSKHLFLSSMHPNQNFKQWYYEILKKRGGVKFRDILDFNNNEEEAIKIENFSFDSFVFNNFFIELDLEKVNKDYLNNLSNEKIDYIHFHADSHFRLFLFPETVFSLREGCVCLGYFGDCFTNFNINKFWMPVFDAFRTTEYSKLEKYKSINNSIIWQRIGVNKGVFGEYGVEKEYDLIFIGRAYGSREKILEFIIKKIPNIKLALYGPNNWKENKILSKYYLGYLDSDDIYSEISKSKISLALLEASDGTTPHINAKVFDSALKDVLVISTYYDLLEVQYSMVNERHIVFYNDTLDLVEKIVFYLKNKKERLRISKNMNQLMKDYTMDSSVNDMMNFFETISSKPIDKNYNNYILIKKNSKIQKNIAQYKYVVVTSSKPDKFLDYLIGYWDAQEFLTEINIANIAAKGLVLNYKIPTSFDGVIYNSKFFIEHERIIVSSNFIFKYILFFFNYKKITLLKMLLFRKENLTFFENYFNKTTLLIKKIKRKF